jgi:hypothetical protein
MHRPPISRQLAAGICRVLEAADVTILVKVHHRFGALTCPANSLKRKPALPKKQTWR